MKLKRPEGSVIVFEAGTLLYPIVRRLLGDEAELIHVRDPQALNDAIEKEGDSIALLLAADENEPQDTLEVLEAYQNQSWFEGALSFVAAETAEPGRAQWAEEMGIGEYVSVAGLPAPAREQLLTDSLRRQLRLMKKLQHLKQTANLDGLTGLCNHTSAAALVTKTLENNPQQEFLFAIIDIDFFKQVNDVRGHEFGDRVLQEEAQRIRQLAGEQAIAIRYGGDEFVLMLPADDDLQTLSQEIYEKIPFRLEGYRITNSIGITSTQWAGRKWKYLFRQADQALYMAKANGRNQFCVYSEQVSNRLDGVGQELRGETLNLNVSALIHAMVNGCGMVYHLDLNQVAVTTLCKKATGAYGWSEPVDYIPFVKNLLDFAEEKSRLRFSEFINPNTLAGRMNAQPTLTYFFAGADGKNYRAEYWAGDRDQNGRIDNALLVIKETEPSESGALSHDETATDKCMASGLLQTYNAIWIIHPDTLSRELVNTQTDLSRHRRINRLFEGGDYWEDTQGYFRLYVSQEEQDRLLSKLHPDVVFREVAEHGTYTQRFHRRVDGVTYLCEYTFLGAMYGEEKVLLQLYRRLRETGRM